MQSTTWDYRRYRTLGRKAGYTAQEHKMSVHDCSISFPLPPGKTEEKLLKMHFNVRMHTLWLCKTARKQFLIPIFFLQVCVCLHMPAHTARTQIHSQNPNMCKHTECSTHLMFTHTGEQLNTAIIASISMLMHTDKTWDFQQSSSNSV